VLVVAALVVTLIMVLVVASLTKLVLETSLLVEEGTTGALDLVVEEVAATMVVEEVLVLRGAAVVLDSTLVVKRVGGVAPVSQIHCS